MELLAAWRDGDQRAGKLLFQRHYAKISRFFYNKASEDDAADLIQRCFLRCIEHQSRKRPETSFGAYLFGIARNVLYEYYRRKRRGRELVDFQTCTLADLGPTPSSQLGHQREAQLLLQALRQIPVEMQVTLELYMFEGLSGKEIAAITNAPLGTVRTRIHRGKQQLQKRVEALTHNPALRESTMSGLEHWARMIRQRSSQPS